MEAGNALCSRCISINFKAINAIDVLQPIDIAVRLLSQTVFWQSSSEIQLLRSHDGRGDSLTWSIVPVFDLGLTVEAEGTSCRVCHFLGAVSRRMKHYHPASHWYLGITTVTQKRLYLVGAAMSWEQDTAERGEILINLTEDSSFITDDIHDVPSTSQVRYQTLTAWVEACIEEGSTYTLEKINITNNNEISGLKVIDCTNRRVIPAPAVVEYIALSYVWGPQSRSSDQFTLPDGAIIESKLSQTITDAIHVTMALGLNYLWIDRYCIDQSNHQTKLKEISQMHRIFYGAWATIVALGQDETSGLSGVSSNRELLSVSIPHYHLRHIGSDVVTYHASSEWSARAWTYQECFLSPRLLSFTPTQVFMVCQHCSLQEALPQHSHPKLQDWVDSEFNLSRLHVPVTKARLLGTQLGIVLHFPEALRNYSSRALTYEADSLFAFQGYISSLQMVNCLGIPLYVVREDDGKTVDVAEERSAKLIGGSVGLAWFEQSTKHTAKSTMIPPPDATTNEQVCKDFPSWSWTSCRPGIKAFSCYHLREDHLDRDKITYHAMDICLEQSHGTLVQWSTLTSSVFTGMTNILHLRTRLLPFRIPPQQTPNDFVLAFQSSIFRNLIELPSFSGISFPWPISSTSTALGLGTSKVTFYPDIRPPCVCHKHLHISPNPGDLDSEIYAVAALLFVEKQRIWQQYIIANWLVLRQDEAGLMRRVGLLKVEFDASPSWTGSGTGDEDAAYGWMWRSFKDLLDQDLAEDGNVGWVKIR